MTSVLATMVLCAVAQAPLIVLDPGHGGEKSGARTPAGVAEKQVTLAVAQRAGELLTAAGLRVVLTRTEDVDVPLADRVALANAQGAAVFVSIHANWSPVASRVGAETYILSPDASDGEAAAVVHLENEEEGGVAEPGRGGEKASDLDLILGDLARMEAHKDSAALAKLLQNKIAAVPGLGPNRGLRQAPFLVLRGAAMPAALVELGYLSSPRQGGVLASAAAQKGAGEAIAAAVRAFVARTRK